MHLRLENFDGPLDLLLYLIKAQELNIFNIPIAYITEQFLSFLKQAPELDFHTAGEYLTTAAQLIEIKANMLIPVLQRRLHDPHSLEEIQEEDPRKQLVEQLLEFEALKKASEFLAQAGKMQEEIIPSHEFKRREEELSCFEHPIKGNPFDLVIAFERILLKFSSQKPTARVTIRAQKITIQHKMITIKKQLITCDSFTLKDFIVACLSRYELIVTIMAVLELCKANHLHISQEVAFGDIIITKGTQFFEEATSLTGMEGNS
jgi:segregation and condensation protein A